MKKGIIVACMIFFVHTFFAQNRVSVDAEVRRVQGGQAVTVKKSIFFSPNGRMVVHFTHPEEYFLITNRFGEARIFNPQTNEVMVINDRSLSSDVIPLFYFLNNQTTDLGLRDLGFTLTNTRRDGNFLIRTFTPPAQLRANLSRVEIVHENHLPIFVAHYNTNNQIVRRMFFSNYERFNALSLPQRITEITNISPTDSIVSRLLYSNIKVGADATSPKFNFTIPSDARVVDESLLRQPFSGR